MLVALISLQDSGSGLRWALQIGGVSVARAQLALALALGAERIFCLAPGINPCVLDLQHQAEAARCRFQVITGPRGLLGQLSAGDELLVMADGLFVSVPEAQALLEAGPVVLVQPAELGLDAGFERIDASLASGGAIRLPGRLVERLGEVPADYDAFSALLRIALQAGITRRSVPPSGSGIWALVRSEAEAQAIEPQWIRRQTGRIAPFTPSRGLAQGLARAFGAALLHAGSGSRSLAGAAALLALLGLGAGWFGWIGTGLALTMISWILAEIGGFLRRIEGRAGDQPGKGGWPWMMAYGWGLDVILVLLLTWAEPVLPGQGVLDRCFPALMLIGLLRLVPRAIRAPWTAWLEDRAILAALVGLALLAGVAGLLVQAAALGLALLGIAWPRSRLG